MWRSTATIGRESVLPLSVLDGERQRACRPRHDEIKVELEPQAWSAPSPRSCGERVGVRGYLHVNGESWTRGGPPHPDRIPLRCMRSDLSPQAGRGDANSGMHCFNQKLMPPGEPICFNFP